MKVRFSNQATIGRFLRSLYVGRMTEYLFWLGLAMVSLEKVGRGEFNKKELRWKDLRDYGELQR